MHIKNIIKLLQSHDANFTEEEQDALWEAYEAACEAKAMVFDRSMSN